ncbi:MAG: hypothetical protein M1812_002438 [Candelaria pacifica]|nr:MAG: hypothetical protein M1812_002438 [Candelaria pacifica]
MSKSQNIVILGGSFSGLGIAHNLLRHTIPALTSADPSTSYKVLLITPSTHFLWMIGAPRALVSEELVPIDKTLLPIKDGFKDYPAEAFEFIQGEAIGLNTTSRKVDVKLTTSGSEQSVDYHALIIATGGHTSSALWSQHGSHEKTVQALKETRDALRLAQSIIVLGGGAAGTETAGELGSAFGSNKDITLISGSTRLLPKNKASLGQDAETYLKNMGVKVKHGVRVAESEKTSTGKTTLTLTDRTTITTDVYIEATGVSPNTNWLPKELLDPKGYVKTDPDYLRVIGAGDRVYAIGTVGSYSKGSVFDSNDAIAPLMTNIEYDLSNGKTGKEKKVVLNQKETIVVPVGRDKGVGILFGWRVPSLMVWAVKGRTFFVEKAPEEVMGTKYTKRSY